MSDTTQWKWSGRRALGTAIGIWAAVFGWLAVSGVAAGEDEGDVPYVPTPQKVVNKMLKMAEISKDDVVYDLGCGDGRIVVTAADKYGAKGIGVDIDPQRIKESRKNAKEKGVTDLVEFREQDLFKTDLTEATIVTLYLLPDVNRKLRPKLLKQLRPGARVVSHSFDMDEWKADKKVRVVEKEGGVELVDVGDFSEFGVSLGSSGSDTDSESDSGESSQSESDSSGISPVVGNSKATLYKWVVPADFAGVWSWTLKTSAGKRTYGAILKQTFQGISGQMVRPDQTKATVTNGKVKGYQVRFEVPEALKSDGQKLLFEGRLDPKRDVIEGNVTIFGNGEEKTLDWKAIRANPLEDG